MEQKPKVAITKETKKRLDQRGNKTDTYNDIISRLLDKLEVDERLEK